MHQNANDARKESNLTEDQIRILDEKETEPPFSGKYVDTKQPGVYTCVRCGNELFRSDTKYDSKSGWPSFYDVLGSGSIQTAEDISHGMTRTEVRCGKCDGHLGHVFTDGPEDKTGLRYCINSAVLQLDTHE